MDAAGNETIDTYYFRTLTFRESIVIWRELLQNFDSDNNEADSIVAQAVEQLRLALMGYDSQNYGITLLSLEETFSLMRQVSILDSDITDFYKDVRLTLELGIDWFNAQRLVWEQEPARVNKPTLIEEMFARSDQRTNSLEAHPNTGARGHLLSYEQSPLAVGDGLLSLADAYFWSQEGRWPQDLSNINDGGYADTRILLLEMLTQMQTYIDSEQILDQDGVLSHLPGKSELAPLMTQMLELQTYINIVVSEGDTTPDDYDHAIALLLMTSMAEQFKAIESQSLWIRNWQWGMAQIVFIYSRRALRNASTWVGPDNLVLLEGYAAFERAEVYREQFRADSYMQELIDSRCILTGVHNFVYTDEEDQVETPLACCDLLIDVYQPLDDRVVIPDACIVP